MKTYWKKGQELHVQDLNVGNDLSTQDPEATWGTYCPLTESEHRQRGYVKISLREARTMAEQCGYDL